MTDRERVARALWDTFKEPGTWDTGTLAGRVRYLEAADAAIAAMAPPAVATDPIVQRIRRMRPPPGYNGIDFSHNVEACREAWRAHLERLWADFDAKTTDKA